MSSIKKAILSFALIFATANGYSYSEWDFSPKQKAIISAAESIGVNDGHPATLVPAILLQESGIGTNVEHKTYMGVGQMSVVATNEVIKTFPEVGNECKINTTMPKSKLKQIINRDAKCGVQLTSKYLVILKSRYKFTTVSRLIMAYNVGPIAARHVAINNYTKSVISNMSKIRS